MGQAAGSGAAGGTTYAERLAVPAAIWTVTLVLWVVFSVAMGAALGPWGGAGVLLVGGTGLVVGLRSAAGHVSVVGSALVAGRAALPLSFAGETRALDAVEARALRGPGADPRAFLYLRGWVPTAVRVEVTDPSDPAPYWYVSTRRPDDVVAAVDAARPPTEPT